MPSVRKTHKKEVVMTQDFEKSLAQLNQCIEAMEAGNLSLAACLQHFETGIALIAHCQNTLQHAEKTVKILTEKSGKSVLTDFTPTDE
jgi:exodeoxyribonuclease VII small subunit